MSEKMRTSIIIILFLAAAAGIFFSARYYVFRPFNIDGDLLSGEESQAEQIFRGAQITVYGDDDNMHWIIESDVIKRYKEDEKLFLDRLEAEAFEEDNLLVKVSASEGKVNIDSGDIDFIGSVRVEYPVQEIVLRADFLHWDGRKKDFSASGDVELKQNGVLLTAGSLTGDQNLEEFIFEDEVKGVKNN